MEQNTESTENITTEDFKKLLQSAESGDIKAQCSLAYCYIEGRGTTTNFEKAAEWWYKAAEQGYADAQYNLGVFYIRVKENAAEAFKWFLKAAEQGQADAQYRLVDCYLYGKGTEVDQNEAGKWLQKAAENGNADAQTKLGYILCGMAEDDNPDFAEFSKFHVEAVKWFRLAAEQGNSDACFELGFSYNYGEGVDIDYDEAVKWYRKAIEIEHNPSALSHLGECYHYGHGVPQNEKEARDWFWLAENRDGLYGIYYIYQGNGVRLGDKESLAKANHGDIHSQMYIAHWYEEHSEVNDSAKKAAYWYQKAAVQGNAAAQANLGDCYYYGRGVEKDKTTAVKWYTKAAEQGNTMAISKLGDCYYEGNGVKQDYKEAVKCYLAIEENGDQQIFPVITSDIARRLSDCYRLGNGVDKDMAKAEEWQNIAEEKEREEDEFLW